MKKLQEVILQKFETMQVRIELLEAEVDTLKNDKARLEEEISDQGKGGPGRTKTRDGNRGEVKDVNQDAHIGKVREKIARFEKNTLSRKKSAYVEVD